MNATYLGEVNIDWKQESEFSNYKRKDWALYFILRFGGIDGAHHKNWVLDQVVRILNGSKIIVRKASWSNGTSEFRVSVGKSKSYKKWVYDLTHDENGEEVYGYDCGIAP